MELLETALKRLDLPALATGCGTFRRQFLQVIADQASQSSISVHSNLPQLLNEFVIQGQGDIHVHIIRETLNQCKCLLSPDTRGCHCPRDYFPSFAAQFSVKRMGVASASVG